LADDPNSPSFLLPCFPASSKMRELLNNLPQTPEIRSRLDSCFTK
jgi:hypothetical protein